MTKLQAVQSAAKRCAKQFGLKGVTVVPAVTGHAKYVVSFEYKGRHYTIRFGHKDFEDYHDHKDKQRRDRYIARASQIRNKSGALTRDDPTSRNCWAMHCLWQYR